MDLTFFNYHFFQINDDIKLTQQMKRQAVIVALKAKHSDLEITHILKVVQSFIVKVHKELKIIDRDPTVVAKHEMSVKDPNTIRTPIFERWRKLSIRTSEIQLILLLSSSSLQGTLSEE